jgi:putative serine protease PepD
VGAGALAAIAATALVAGGIGGYMGYRVAEPSTSSLPPAAVGTLDRPDGSVAAIVEETLPSVVKIEALNSTGIATGSGFVIREDGYLLTNNHVIKSATAGLVVVFADGTEENADVVGSSQEYDLAVLKIDRGGFSVTRMRSWSATRSSRSARPSATIRR